MINLKQLPKYAVLGVVLVGIYLAFSEFFTKERQSVRVAVRLPELSADAVSGKVAFDANYINAVAPLFNHL